MAEQQINLNFFESVAHHCDENVDEDDDDRDEVSSKHDETDFLHVLGTVNVCTR